MHAVVLKRKKYNILNKNTPSGSIFVFVVRVGIEPTRLAARDFKSLVYTSFTTGPISVIYLYHIIFHKSSRGRQVHFVV